MNSNPKLSIIIIVYNQEQYIDECVKSVIKQTYQNIEIVIVDDGSTDGTAQICDNYKKYYEHVKVVHQNNGGSVSARKTGLAIATGGYVSFIDGDDWVETDLFEKAMENIGEADIIAYGLTCFYSDGHQEYMLNRVGSGKYAGNLLDDVRNRVLFDGELGSFGILPSLCTKVFKKSILEQNMYNTIDEIRMGDDCACSVPAICDANEIVIDNSIRGYMYRKSLSQSQSSLYQYNDFIKINNLFITLYASFENKKANNMLEQLLYYLVFLFRTEIVQELASPNIGNIIKKIRNLKEIKNLEWIKYIRDNVCFPNNSIDKETELLIKSIDNTWELFYKWYIVRKLKINCKKQI